MILTVSPNGFVIAAAVVVWILLFATDFDLYRAASKILLKHAVHSSYMNRLVQSRFNFLHFADLRPNIHTLFTNIRCVYAIIYKNTSL